MSAPKIKDEMKRRYKIIISPPQLEVARRMVFDKIQVENNEQFARLQDYELDIKSSKKIVDQDYRPIISVDGIFLKHYVQEIILTAIGSDPNTQIYIIAWNVVSVKNNEN
ncbi:hypothetical protein DY000_02022573 [Brassica cretica]|uniref:Uncharacterized protein n=1 Tax=Brassica cretica TaxID=69181 RepID=A0ABQ7ECR4_BRACR|nr:hypothetical protein DY000_02022573 [Brassica cretica]